jgi:predicted RNA-binding protein
MCEAAAYVLRNGREEIFLESVDVLECKGNDIRMVNIFGEQKDFRGKVKALSLVDHKIILEPL